MAKTYPTVGDRIKLTGTMKIGPDNSKLDPSSPPVGTEGTVRMCNPNQIDVEWDNGSSLFLLPEDPFIVL